MTAWHPGGNYLALSNKEQDAAVVNVKKLERVFSAKLDYVAPDLAFTPDGRRLILSGFADKVEVWDWKAGKLERTIRLQITENEPVQPSHGGLAISSDGKFLAAFGNGTVQRPGGPVQWRKARILELSTGREVRVFDARGSQVAFSKDGRYLLADSGERWDLRTGEQLPQFLERPSFGMRIQAFGPRRDLMAAVNDRDGAVHIYKAKYSEPESTISAANKSEEKPEAGGKAGTADRDSLGSIGTSTFEKLKQSLNRLFDTSPDKKVVVERDAPSLMQRFDKVFDSLFYKESIVFRRDNNIWVMDADGKNQRQLTQNPLKEGYDEFETSKDGKLLTYIDSSSNCHILFLTSGKTKPVTEDSGCLEVAISPNGRLVAFITVASKFSKADEEIEKKRNPDVDHIGAGAPKTTAIALYDVPTALSRTLVTGLPTPPGYGPENPRDATAWFDSGLFWKGDGSEIYFRRSFHAPSYKRQPSYVHNIRTGEIRYSDAGFRLVAWIEDKAVTSYEGYDSLHDIAVNSELPAPERDKRLYFLDSDSRSMLFITEPCSLYVYDAKSNEYRVLDAEQTTEKWDFIGIASFSRDSATIAYLKRCGNARGLWTISSDGKIKNRINLNIGNDDIGSWSPNNKRLLLIGRNEALRVLDVQRHHLADIGAKALSPAWALVPRTTMVSASTAKIIALVVLAILGFLLLLGLALIARKSMRLAITKRRMAAAQNLVHCTECGARQMADASFCTKCGAKLG